MYDLNQMQICMNAFISDGWKLGYVHLGTNEICCLMKSSGGCVYKALFELIEE